MFIFLGEIRPPAWVKIWQRKNEGLISFISIYVLNEKHKIFLLKSKSLIFLLLFTTTYLALQDKPFLKAYIST